MKRFTLMVSVIGVLAFLAGCKKNNQKTDCNNYPIPSDTYKYPIVPGMPAWASFQTGEEMLQACQIPANVLSAISTEGLIQSWLDFPLNYEIFSTNSIQKSMEYFMSNFSGLRELAGRSDAANKLFKRYQSLDPTCVLSYKTDVEQGNYTFLFSYSGLLCSQDTILNQMDFEEKKMLVSEAIKKYNTQFEYFSYYGRMPLEHCLFICARVMKSCQYQPFLNQINSNLLWFVNNAQFYIPAGDYSTEMNVILSHSLNFIK